MDGRDRVPGDARGVGGLTGGALGPAARRHGETPAGGRGGDGAGADLYGVGAEASGRRPGRPVAQRHGRRSIRGGCAGCRRDRGWRAGRRAVRWRGGVVRVGSGPAGAGTDPAQPDRGRARCVGRGLRQPAAHMAEPVVHGHGLALGAGRPFQRRADRRHAPAGPGASGGGPGTSRRGAPPRGSGPGGSAGSGRAATAVAADGAGWPRSGRTDDAAPRHDTRATGTPRVGGGYECGGRRGFRRGHGHKCGHGHGCGCPLGGGRRDGTGTESGSGPEEKPRAAPGRRDHDCRRAHGFRAGPGIAGGRTPGPDQDRKRNWCRCRKRPRCRERNADWCQRR
ncbi:hypothetical protein FHS34_004972 [Streptomyces echinatus]|uniref:Uncharacterized protein n=1 Tax=Streptomyces echinatus TaxID=67293 RepID=A0A7W9PWY1_9ACTN|nr:hypothetical protein [Streptomyces echinatus]